MQSHPEKNSSRTITNMDQGKSTSIKNQDASKNTFPHQATIPRPRPKANPVQFEDPYDHIHHMDHHREYTHLNDTKE